MENKLLSTAIQAAMDAGNKILSVYETDFEVEQKQDQSPLTEADKISHETIVSYLSETGIPILSEEGKELPYETRKNWETLWIVDPLDGTKEFVKRNGEFTVNIALIKNQLPVLGVIYVPVLRQLYFGTRTSGAFKVENITGYEPSVIEKNKISLPQITGNRPYTVVASRSHLSPETQEYIDQLKQQHQTVDTISKGSSLKLCMVAEGRADEYPRFAPTMEWDTAAGQAIVEASGAQVIDWQTKQPMLYNRKNLLNNWFLVKR